MASEAWYLNTEVVLAACHAQKLPEWQLKCLESYCRLTDP